MKKKVILAYSGGLDTSVILKWLCNKGYEVICFVADVGQQEDFEQVKKKALNIGASKVYVENLQQEFVEKYIFEALQANAVYEGTYLLGTMSRPLIAQKQIEIARKENTNLLAHGATCKGTDQVRFELTYLSLMPDVQIIAPWKDQEFLEQFKGRTDLIAYAQEQNIPVSATIEKVYSIDANLMYMSYESGKLDDPAYGSTDAIFEWTKSPLQAPDQAVQIAITFEKGIPVAVVTEDGKKQIIGSLPLFKYLNELGALHGIGRIDIVENRFTGMKIRGIYETPAGTILWKAHRDLEGLTLDREVAHLKDMLVPKIAEIIYNGFWFSPEMKFLMAAIHQSQENVSGTVYMKLYKGNAYITGRKSHISLYSKSIASMDELDGFNPMDAQGFIKIQALRLRMAHKVQELTKRDS